MWCILPLLFVTAFSQRKVINNDFDWKFKLGNVDATEDLCPPSAFPTTLTDIVCPGVHAVYLFLTWLLSLFTV
jgi:hypothetical protein